MTHLISSLRLGFAGLRFCAALTTGSSLAADDHPAPTPQDPVIKRADIVFDASPALTPQVVLAAHGDLIVLWNTRGDGMPGQATQFARSSDGGRTWSEPYLTIQSDQPLTGSGSCLYHLPEGHGTAGSMLLYTLELVWPGEPDQARPDYEGLAAGRLFDSFYSFSQDSGQTFSERKRLSDPVKRDDFAQGPIVTLPNGDLLWPWGYWGSEPLNGFRRSTDGGLTWNPVVRAWQDPPPGHDTPVAFNETAAAVCNDGTLVAIARVDTLRDKKLWQITSSDNGQTWTTPRPIEIAGGSPALYCTPQGQLWLAYRDAGLGPGLGLAVSDDQGETWRFLYHLKDPKGGHEKRFGQTRYTDEDRQQQWRPAEGVVGYPCFAPLSEREVYVVFHLQSWEKVDFPFYIAGNLLEIPE
jgi:hypothetical protein